MVKSSKLLYILQLFAFFPLLVPYANANTLLYSNEFTNGLGPNVESAQGGCYPYSFGVASPLKDGNNALRVEVRGLEGCIEDSGVVKHRALLHHGYDPLTGGIIRFLPRTPYWVGLRLFVPNDYPTDRSDGVIIFSLIAAGVPGETGFNIFGSNLKFGRRWDALDGKGLQEDWTKVPVQKGKWVDLVVYLYRSWTNDGVLKVWQNGQLVVNKVNMPNATDYGSLGAQNPKFRTGIYFGAQDRDANYVLHFDNVRIATGTNGYDLVNPATASAPPPPLAAPSGLQLEVH